MEASAAIRQFCARHPYVGAVIWMTSTQFFIAQPIVALGWPTGYSVRDNTISDLGITVCGIYDGRYVCSPWYSWMNASMVFLGFSMILGSLLLYHQFGRNTGSRIGFVLMGIGGFGTTLVGLFPANVAAAMHAIGAFLPFFIGNLSLIFLGLYLKTTLLFRFFTVLTGIFSLAAFMLLTTDNYLGIGIGGMERLVAHPQTLWLIIFGYYVSNRMLRHKPALPPKK